MKKRVVVAMSGGVDSSITACLLAKEGYEVIGLSLKLFSSEEKEFTERNSGCCGIQGIEDARAVCQKVGIPFYALNYKGKFEEKVIEYFCGEYENGRTPNPCIICNEKIKFGSLLEKAKSLGAEYIATGHYAKIEYEEETGRYQLRKGEDREKDQSYFLFSLTQQQLEHSLFPLGNYTKDEGHRLAKRFGLKVHDKPASQEICFIQNSDYRSFLKARVPESRLRLGPIINKKSGEILGEHRGIVFYTIGQRKGLGPHTKPLYVIGIDIEKNAILVGEEEELYGDVLIAERVNWIDREELVEPIRVKARIRYKQRESDATVFPMGEGVVKVKFDKPQRAITPGQAVVFYRDEIVVGGGWII